MKKKMKNTTCTESVDGEKIRDISAEILCGLVERDNLGFVDVAAILVDMQTLFDEFLKQEGITINNIKKVYQ